MKRGQNKSSLRFVAGSKKGQFYLFAAIIIIALILGFAAITNYSKTQSSVKLYDLGEELSIESENVLDYGTYNEYDSSNMSNLLEHFRVSYVDFAGEGKELYFIIGNKNGIYLYSYTEIYGGTVSVDVGGKYSKFQISNRQVEQTKLNVEGDKIKVVIEGITHEFDLKPGENFYFVITQEIGGEKHVTKSE
jgi:hypothetical protein